MVVALDMSVFVLNVEIIGIAVTVAGVWALAAKLPVRYALIDPR